MVGRIGVISRGSPDYLIDIVTDGLIRLFGRKSVSLDYNVRGGWGGQYAILLQGVQGPEPFDIRDAEILIGSVRSLEAVEEWMRNTGRRKVAVIDGEDDSRIRDPWPSAVKVYFKREFLKGSRHPANVLPLPFGAIPETCPAVNDIRDSVFFRAHESSPIRKEITEALRSMGHPVPAGRVEKKEYNEALASSLVGVSARGGGWDTYRYWETAYLGTALLSQRPGIVIPDDFEDGREAVFFDTVGDFKIRLSEMLASPERTVDMARAGRQKCLKLHLSVNRARTVLEAVA